MRFVEPESIEKAAAILAADPEARCLAGGATLVAMMNAELVAPSQLVSLRRIQALNGIEAQPDGGMEIGAMSRHATVAAFPGFTGQQRLLSEAARRIGHPAIRNMGTLGGSICHADPSADYPTAILAADATAIAFGSEGRREIPAAEFFLDWFETALEPGELVVAVRLPPSPEDTAVHYEKFTRADGDFATVSVAVSLRLEDGAIAALSLAVGGAAETPLRDRAAEEAVIGRSLDDAAIAELAEALSALCNPIDDLRGSADYRRKLVPRLIARALRAAERKSKQGAEAA
ncbi:MAG: xanthine dehydrogenase family protein subunit M [Rhodovibrionaceae bacterium]